ncbi:hypothetical protein BC826DRAFT_972637 [Russula brevipes]|nr:hypothetical protein BC826DRAFT_972637 [Russula brevipes]
MPTAFLKLPLELLREILSHLSLEDVLSLTSSCKSLSYLGCDSELQLYRTRIREAGLRDCPPPDGLSIRKRLAALRRLESAWDGPVISTDPAVVDIEDADADSRVLVVEDFYIDMNALADTRTDSCGYRYLDLRSSLQQEDVRSVCYTFQQNVGLLCYAFAITKYNLFAVVIEAPWLSDYAALQLLNFHDGQPHPFSARPIKITDEIFCIAKMHIIEDQILIVMTRDFPERPKSWMTLVDGSSRHYLNDIVIVSHDTIALVNPVDSTLELGRLDSATATLHVLRTLCLPPAHSELSLFRASTGPSPLTTAPRRSSSAPPPHISSSSSSSSSPPALFCEDPGRAITSVALHYTATGGTPSHEEWAEPDEHARALLITRRSALRRLAAGRTAQAHTPWCAWGPAAARVLWLAGNGNGGGSVAGHGFGAHATLHERLFLFAGNAHAHAHAPGPAPPPAVAVAQLDFNVHRIRRGVHERERRACAAGRDPRCERKRGTCTGEGERDEYGDDGGGGGERDNGGGGGGGSFTVEDMGLLYRQTSIALPDDSDAFFGTDRIVRVMSQSGKRSARRGACAQESDHSSNDGLKVPRFHPGGEGVVRLQGVWLSNVQLQYGVLLMNVDTEQYPRWAHRKIGCRGCLDVMSISIHLDTLSDLRVVQNDCVLEKSKGDVEAPESETRITIWKAGDGDGGASVRCPMQGPMTQQGTRERAMDSLYLLAKDSQASKREFLPNRCGVLKRRLCNMKVGDYQSRGMRVQKGNANSGAPVQARGQGARTKHRLRERAHAGAKRSTGNGTGMHAGAEADVQGGKMAGAGATAVSRRADSKGVAVPEQAQGRARQRKRSLRVRFGMDGFGFTAYLSNLKFGKSHQGLRIELEFGNNIYKALRDAVTPHGQKVTSLCQLGARHQSRTRQGSPAERSLSHESSPITGISTHHLGSREQVRIKPSARRQEMSPGGAAKPNTQYHFAHHFCPGASGRVRTAFDGPQAKAKKWGVGTRARTHAKSGGLGLDILMQSTPSCASPRAVVPKVGDGKTPNCM